MATDYPPRVRLASPEDESRIVAILDALEFDNGFGVPKDPEKILSQIRVATERRGGAIGVVDGKDGDLVAVVGLFLTSWWYSNEVYVGELFLFVHPDYRSNGFERDLFQFSRWFKEQMSAAMGRPVVLVTSVSSPRRLPAKTRLWRRLSGGRQVGSLFVIE